MFGDRQARGQAGAFDAEKADIARLPVIRRAEDREVAVRRALWHDLGPYASIVRRQRAIFQIGPILAHGGVEFFAAIRRHVIAFCVDPFDVRAELGLPGFAPEIAVTCDNHGGPGLGAIQQWDAAAQSWSLITDFSGADRDVVDALIAEDSAAFASENNITPRDC